MKACRGCDVAQPLDAFAVDRRAPDGRQGRCRTCNTAYRAANAPAVRAAVRAWAAANPAAKTASTRAWRAANPDRLREHRRRQNAARRARLLGAYVEDVDPAVVWARDEGCCRLCGLPALAGWWHLEHLTPLARGGLHSYANVAVAHAGCNERKGTLTLMEFYARVGAGS